MADENSDDRTKSNALIATLVGCLFVVLGFLGVLFYAVPTALDALASGSWPTAPGVITRSTVSEHRSSGKVTYTLCYALAISSGWCGLRALEPAALRPWSDRFCAVVEAQNFWHWRGFADTIRGWVQARLGEPKEGLSVMMGGLQGMSAAGMVIGQPLIMTYATPVYQDLDRIEEGLELIARAEEIIEETREHMALSELRRIKGTCLSSAGDDEAAEKSFSEAIEIASRQQAKVWELRAAVSLARLWQSQGKHEEADNLLRPIYDWFTLGFDTADLKDAKALLDEFV